MISKANFKHTMLKPYITWLLLTLFCVVPAIAQTFETPDQEYARFQAQAQMDALAKQQQADRQRADATARQLQELTAQIEADRQAAFDAAEAERVAREQRVEAKRKAAQKKILDAQWAAAAPERARAAAAQAEIVAKYRATIIHTPNIMVVTSKHSGDGQGATVIVDGKRTEFKTLAEANAFAEDVKQKALIAASQSAEQSPR